MTVKDDLKQALVDALQTNTRIAQLPGGSTITIEDGSAIGRKMSFGFLWMPTSVDPDAKVEYGIAMTEPNGDEGQWFIDIFTGPVVTKGDTNYKINPYLSTALLYDEGQKAVQDFDTELFDDGKNLDDQKFPVIQIVPSFGKSLNSMLGIASMAVQFSLWIHQGIGNSDEHAQNLALPAITSMALNQIVLGFDKQFDGVDVSAIATTWPKYDNAIQNWSTAGGWPKKSNSAYEFEADKAGEKVNIRAWRPSLVLDKESWTIQLKFDRIRTARKDDHVVLAVTAKREPGSGKLTVLAVDTAALLRTLDGTSVAFSTITTSGEDVFADWRANFKLQVSGNPDVVAFALGIVEDVVEPLLAVVAKAES